MDRKGQTGTAEDLQHQVNESLMTVGDLAAYLRVAEKTVLRMVGRGDLPGTKVSGQWRFMRSVIDEWLMSGMRTAVNDDLFALLGQDDVSVPLSRLLNESSIVVDLQPTEPRELLSALVQPLFKQGVVSDAEAYLEALLRREELVSTALGGGVALPHSREPGVGLRGSGLVCGICSQGVDFSAPDAAPVHIFFLICADSVQLHLRLMARVGLLLRDAATVAELSSSRSRDDVFSALMTFERRQFVDGASAN